MKSKFLQFFVLILIFVFFINSTVFAAKDYISEAEQRKNIPIETNEYMNWPQGPKIGAESAILMEINSGAILYEKNIHAKLYPASITKILTALIAFESCNMDDMVTFSDEAIQSIDWKKDANMGINAGDSITMEQCLYGLLVGSANEAAYAIAEHICGPGNLSAFSTKMNEKAKELGCTDSNFITPNGIHNENHYTSAHDMALIAQAFFSNELLTKMSSTTSYHIPVTKTQTREDMKVWAKSKLLKGKEYEYEPLIGTKTGYTDFARQTLVSCAEKNNMKLVCVILKEEAPYQFTDTIELFEYGFENFVSHNVVEEDTKYNIDNSYFFSSNIDFLGSNKAILQIDPFDYIILPVNIDFQEVSSNLNYNQSNNKIIATIEYFLNDIPVGHAHVIPVINDADYFDFSSHQLLMETDNKDNRHIVYINIKTLFIFVVTLSFLISGIFLIKNKYLLSRKYRRSNHSYRKYKNKSKKLDWKHFK